METDSTSAYAFLTDRLSSASYDIAHYTEDLAVLNRRWLRPGHRDDPDDGELEGGAGVREPRRPHPHQPAGAMELELPSGSLRC